MKKVLTLLAVFGLTACFGGMTPPSKFYSLTPIQSSSDVFKSAKLSIGVEEVKVPVSYKLLGYAVCFSMLGYNHYRLFYCRGMMEKTRVVVLYALFASQIYVLPADVVKVEKPLQDNNTVKFELCKVQLCEGLREFRYRVGHRNYLLAEADQRISYDREKIKCLTFRKMSSNTIVKGELKKLML